LNSPADPASRGRGQLPLTIDVEVPLPREGCRRDYLLLTVIACAFSVGFFLYYWHAGELLLYGDAVAHMNIARRVLDSRTPGLLQLGTVWLPLPHLLMLPFIWSNRMWQTGVGGAIPSMVAYVLAVVGIFRLARDGLLSATEYKLESRVSGWFAAMVLALNPNLLYLQATAMTEVLYLACFIWATVFLADFWRALSQGDDRAARRELVFCGVALMLGMMTRYDGWFAAAAYGVALLASLIWAGRRSGIEPLHFLYEAEWRKAIAGFVLLLVVFPCAWFAYNQHEFDDPLAFARGPYSAKGIEARTRKAGEAHHPGWHAPKVAATYFLESAKMNMADGERTERFLLYVAAIASVLLLGAFRCLWPWLMLWVPLPFYAISMAWGGVPIFLPRWWPFSYYNVRYGTQLIPVFAVFGALFLYMFLRRFANRRMKVATVAAGALFVVWSYVGVWQMVPICLREARVNSVDRMAIEAKLGAQLLKLPGNSTVLMYLGQHGGALQEIAFPLQRTINECHKRYWQTALLSPAKMADFVVATEGDPVSEAVREHSDGLVKVAEIKVPRQSPITVYRSNVAR
jgi:hypothetical protein